MAEDDVKPADDPTASEPEPEQAPPPEPAEEPLAGADEAGEGAGEPASDAEADEQDAKEPAKKLSPGALSLCRSAIEAMLFSSAEPVAARKLADALKHTGHFLLIVKHTDAMAFAIHQFFQPCAVTRA